MLKITISENETLVTLKVEGRIAGPCVAEFDHAWRSLVPSLDSRKLTVNLNGVTYIEPHVRNLLAEIHQNTGARFEAGSLLMQSYAREATQSKDFNETFEERTKE